MPETNFKFRMSKVQTLHGALDPGQHLKHSRFQIKKCTVSNVALDSGRHLKHFQSSSRPESRATLEKRPRPRQFESVTFGMSAMNPGRHLKHSRFQMSRFSNVECRPGPGFTAAFENIKIRNVNIANVARNPGRSNISNVTSSHVKCGIRPGLQRGTPM